MVVGVIAVVDERESWAGPLCTSVPALTLLVDDNNLAVGATPLLVGNPDPHHQSSVSLSLSTGMAARSDFDLFDAAADDDDDDDDDADGEG